ncbi:unnamed protein product [Peronospora belbahrii]|uniref:AAA+ ATPase domain-containing protein n=1 Tax=Peronospora belbahrii TaxID=622444 RepID=A0AAU9L138_9STRA|nr:unnamed protein product [Peronospora belbahrii]
MRAFTILVLTAIKLFDSHAVPAFASVAIPKSLQQTFDVTEASIERNLRSDRTTDEEIEQEERGPLSTFFSLFFSSKNRAPINEDIQVVSRLDSKQAKQTIKQAFKAKDWEQVTNEWLNHKEYKEINPDMVWRALGLKSYKKRGLYRNSGSPSSELLFWHGYSIRYSAKYPEWTSNILWKQRTGEGNWRKAHLDDNGRPIIRADVAIAANTQVGRVQRIQDSITVVQKLLSCCLLWLISNTSSLALKRIKLNRDRAGYFLTTVTRPRIKLPPVNTQDDDNKPKPPLVVENLKFTANYGDKVVLVGRNSADKTTLMRLLSKSLTPNHGQFVKNDVVCTATNANEGKIRSHLSSLALLATLLFRFRFTHFQGGQLVRVGLAWSTLPNPPHVLLLDEPTNHLDMVTIEMLRKALRKYQGAVVIISHDLHFLDILTNRSKQEEADDGITRCGCVRIVEVIKKKGLVSLLPLEGVEAYREKEERRNASLGRM